MGFSNSCVNQSLTHLTQDKAFVIVALPEEANWVRKISSEKEPHLTLLYLGNPQWDANQMRSVLEYIEHAVSQLRFFVADVEDRGELGEKRADVLFFDKYAAQTAEDFRNHLLQNEEISKAYLSVEQFPTWTPHLTMGYPETPAKKIEADYGGYSYVNFDRIALWTGDYTGPTYKLRRKEVTAMHAEIGLRYVNEFLSHQEEDEEDEFNLEEEYGDFLDLLEARIAEVDPSVTHYGVKGMKWGVRREDRGGDRTLKSLGPDTVSRKTASGETITLKKVPPNKIHKALGRISKKYREGYARNAYLDILDGSGKKVGDAHVQKRSKDELYLNWLGIDKSARGKGYATAVMQAGRDFGKQQGFKRMVLEVPGESPDAKHIYEKMGFKYTGKHTDDPFWGGLSDMVYEFDKVKHGDGDSVTHYGVKGMKWGVRRTDAQLSSAAKKPSEDYRNAARAQRQANRGGTKTLSNKELQDVITRMNLERQYSTLSGESQKGTVDRGHDQVKKALAIGATIESVRRFLDTPTGQAVKAGATAAAKMGFAYATGGAGPAAAAGAGVAIRTVGKHYTNVGN